MREKAKVLSTLVLAIALELLVVQVAEASPPMPNNSYEVRIEPTALPKRAGPAEFELVFGPPARRACDSVQVTITTTGGLLYHGNSSFNVELTVPFEYRTTLSVTIPAEDTSSFAVELSCGDIVQEFRRVFITTSDTLRISSGMPRKSSTTRRRSVPQEAESPRARHIDRDTLTTEQLDALHDVIVLLEDPVKRKLVEDRIGRIPDAAACRKSKEVFFLKLSLRDIYYFLDQGIQISDTSEVPARIQDSLGIPGAVKDSCGTTKKTEVEGSVAPESFDGRVGHPEAHRMRTESRRPMIDSPNRANKARRDA